MAAIVTFWLSEPCKFGAVCASAVPSAILALGINLLSPAWQVKMLPLAAAWFGASFAGMTSMERLAGRYWSAIVGLDFRSPVRWCRPSRARFRRTPWNHCSGVGNGSIGTCPVGANKCDQLAKGCLAATLLRDSEVPRILDNPGALKFQGSHSRPLAGEQKQTRPSDLPNPKVPKVAPSDAVQNKTCK